MTIVIYAMMIIIYAIIVVMYVMPWVTMILKDHVIMVVEFYNIK
jgi:hypothetical protein